MSLAERVRAVFAADGLLSHAADHFTPREAQTDMALAVAQTVEAGGVLVVEAGTGVGKTFSYLVPALLSGERVLVSTATKTLQDQLFGRDLPRLVQALGISVRTALLKGRSSYLCLHRMQTARQNDAAIDRAAGRALGKIEQWAQATRTGDLAELPGLDERSPLIPLVTSTRENCLGAQCPQFRACHVNLARRDALAADLVVVNHHLFFADLAVRESGMAELLPTVRVAIFDEAHQLNETGVQFLGRQLGTGQLLDFARDILATGMQAARGLVDWPTAANGLERAAQDLRMAVGRQAPGARMRWSDAVPDGADPSAWEVGLATIQQALDVALAGLDMVSELAPDFGRLHERGTALSARLQMFAQPSRIGQVRWVDVGAQLRLVESPLDIADTMRTRLLALPADGTAADPAPPGAEPEGREGEGADGGRPRAWIFTSATLGDDPALRWFTEPCGLDGSAQVLRVGSPFDYERQAALYVPDWLPRPADPGHAVALARLCGDAAARLGGRTLVLTTTLRALRTIGEALSQRFGASRELEILVQGEWPKRRLMERFREGGGDGRPGCVLVASASFWEGVDVPGDALQLVVLDKLPFPPPNDPLVEARAQRLEQEGRSPFKDYFVPEAAVALQQGAGRLIRRETDRGVLVVGDTRLTTMSYGKRLLRALPPMRRLSSDAEFHEALDALTTPSTTDPYWP
ncbi:ATP-dependent DNA helicase [Xylophilus sp. Leaf220]|uniref:ATP-dependent DNA helicase n=1 Tax=Xylophilus sp. Leaf220 TaxID=1735686 RepID=UPI0006F5F7F5|nr:ATP-dependent DNA helicase [Xylophilus sp. Leaf220]KQM75593.1 helicase [Xylophilus sp. Leaf220]